MRKVFKEIYPYIIIIISVLIIRKFIVTPIRVIGPSMMHTLIDGDIMILDKISYRFKNIKRFDIVVISSLDKPIIKRVIGLPGDIVESKNNKLYINGEEIKEDYLDGDAITSSFSVESISGVEKIPKGYYLVLGDNREESQDSRAIGLIKRSQIEGKTSLTVFPFNRIGMLD